MEGHCALCPSVPHRPGPWLAAHGPLLPFAVRPFGFLWGVPAPEDWGNVLPEVSFPHIHMVEPLSHWFAGTGEVDFKGKILFPDELGLPGRREAFRHVEDIHAQHWPV